MPSLRLGIVTREQPNRALLDHGILESRLALQFAKLPVKSCVHGRDKRPADVTFSSPVRHPCHSLLCSALTPSFPTTRRWHFYRQQIHCSQLTYTKQKFKNFTEIIEMSIKDMKYEITAEFVILVYIEIRYI